MFHLVWSPTDVQLIYSDNYILGISANNVCISADISIWDFFTSLYHYPHQPQESSLSLSLRCWQHVLTQGIMKTARWSSIWYQTLFDNEAECYLTSLCFTSLLYELYCRLRSLLKVTFRHFVIDSISFSLLLTQQQKHLEIFSWILGDFSRS